MDGSVTLTQHHTFQPLFDIISLKTDHIKLHDTPCNAILDNNPTALTHQQTFNYRSTVGYLSYIQSIVHPDITMPAQHCARFYNNSNKDYDEAFKYIAQYQLKTKNKFLIFHPDLSKGLEYYVDTDWVDLWHHCSSHDPLSTHPITGFCFTYAKFPII